jgi:hypothetical protein
VRVVAWCTAGAPGYAWPDGRLERISVGAAVNHPGKRGADPDPLVNRHKLKLNIIEQRSPFAPACLLVAKWVIQDNTQMSRYSVIGLKHDDGAPNNIFIDIKQTTAITPDDCGYVALTLIDRNVRVLRKFCHFILCPGGTSSFGLSRGFPVRLLGHDCEFGFGFRRQCLPCHEHLRHCLLDNP